MNAIQDEETGEIFPKPQQVDTETGEYSSDYLLQNNHVPPTRKFQIPKEFLKSDSNHKGLDGSEKLQESFPICNRKTFYSLNEDIMLGQNTVSYRLLLLLPILFICPKLPALLIAIFEIGVHMWCHKKNKRLSDPGLYYRSPLHILTSEYCAYCQSQKQMDKISRIQDKRKFRHLKSAYNCVST